MFQLGKLKEIHYLSIKYNSKIHGRDASSQNVGHGMAHGTRICNRFFSTLNFANLINHFDF